MSEPKKPLREWTLIGSQIKEYRIAAGETLSFEDVVDVREVSPELDAAVQLLRNVLVDVLEESRMGQVMLNNGTRVYLKRALEAYDKARGAE